MSQGLKTIFHKPNFGLLFLRIALGSMIIAHGVPKFLGGSKVLTSIGKEMSVFGVTAFPLLWGFMAALVETLGGFLMIIGFRFRVATFFLTFVMVTATLSHYYQAAPFNKIAWPVEMAIIFFSLTFIGPGKFSIDKG